MSYSIIRSTRTREACKETVVASGLPDFKTADAQRNELDAAERRAHPGKTSWVRDIFIVRQEATHV